MSSAPEVTATATAPPAKRVKTDETTMATNGDALLQALRVKKINPNAVLPTRGSSGSAGYDISSVEDTVIPARGKAIVATGLQIAIPEGTCT